MTTREFLIDGKKVQGVEISLAGAPLIMVHGARGFVMCGYLDLQTADKVKAAAAVVRGVSSVDELLAKPVGGVSAAAAALGVKLGMTGRDALSLLAE
ncbi:MAG: DUF1805 domain-containing protein [Elusimicrobia bacterium]|nr:DUF1805 domain-containing protein [Elusimicrobiota bacterium]